MSLLLLLKTINCPEYLLLPIKQYLTMRILSVISILLVSCFASHAQIISSNNPASTLVLGAYTHTVHDGFGYVPTDSGVLKYDSGFNYNRKTSTYQFDTNFIYTYNPSAGYTQNLLQVESYDTLKNLIYDITLRKDGSGNWIDSLKYTYTYDANNNMSSYTMQKLNISTGTWTNLEKHLYTSDAAGNRLTDIIQKWDVPTASWSFLSEHAYTYNSKNTMVSDTFKYINPMYMRLMDSTVSEYTYDTAGNLTLFRALSVTFVPASYSYYYPTKYMYEYQYNSITKDLDQKLHEVPSTHGPGWFIDSIIYYTFDTSHNLVYEENPHYYNNTFEYDTAHNLLSATYVVWNVGGPIKPSFRHFYSYNSDNLVTMFTYELYDIASGKWKGQTQDRYYYITPPPPKRTAVGNVNQQMGSLLVYPSPANSVLNIDIHTQKELPIIIAIYDMQGRIWSQWQVDAALFSHSSIPVSQMPAGNYILNVKNESGQVSKMFTVAH